MSRRSNRWLLLLAILSLLLVTAPTAGARQGPRQRADAMAGCRFIGGIGRLWCLALTQRPFAPTDITLFDQVAYPDAPEASPAPAYDRTFEVVEQELREILERRLAGDQARIETAMALLHDPDLGAIVPNPILRAAMIALTGTVAEPAIDYVANAGAFEVVAFAEFDGTILEGGSAFSVTPGDSDRPTIVFNNDNIYESLLVLSALLAHEFAHSEGGIIFFEELFANTVQAIVHMQNLALFAEIADDRSDFSNRANTLALALLNTHEPRSAKLHITSPAGDVFPNSPNDDSDFVAYISRFYRNDGSTSPANEASRAYLANILGVPVSEIPTDLDHKTAVEMLDGIQVNPDVLSFHDLLRVGCALKLDVPIPCVVVENVPDRHDIDRFAVTHIGGGLRDWPARGIERP